MEQKELTIVNKRTRFEGSNICTWIGFKHVLYLVEEATLEHFRQSGYSPRELFEKHGICLEIVDQDARILHALHMDDNVRIEVKPNTMSKDTSCLNYKVSIFVERDGKEVKAVISKVKVLFRRDTFIAPAESTVPQITPYVVSEIKRGAPATLERNVALERGTVGAVPKNELIRGVVSPDQNCFVWKWHIPYFYCHFTERMQHSGYLRQMEEVVDLFLADRGISIWKMLETRKWIPVVPTAQVEILREAYMEETLYTVFTVEQIVKDTTYDARMDCYVERDGGLVHTATGHITHGYAVIENRRDWSLVQFDAETLTALRGKAK